MVTSLLSRADAVSVGDMTTTHAAAFAQSVATDVDVLVDLIDQEDRVTFISPMFEVEVAGICEDGFSFYRDSFSVNIWVETDSGYKPMRVRITPARPTYEWKGPELTGQDSALSGRRLTHRFGPRAVEPETTPRTRERRTPPVVVAYFPNTNTYRHLGE